MRTTVLPVILPAKAYAELERQARIQERHPVRQAQWILKQALGEPTDHPDPNLTTVAAGSRG